MIKIALDVMGGDNAPVSTINGAIDFLNHNDDSVKIYLVGPKNNIKAQLTIIFGRTPQPYIKSLLMRYFFCLLLLNIIILAVSN